MPIRPPSILPGEDRLDLQAPGRDVKEVLDFFTASLTDDGHTVLNTDYEGFEAEVYFQMQGNASPGLVMVLVGCGDEGTIVSIRVAETP